MIALTGFRILLARDGRTYRVDEDGRAQFVAKLSARMKQIGNPEFDIRLRTLANAAPATPRADQSDPLGLDPRRP